MEGGKKETQEGIVKRRRKDIGKVKMLDREKFLQKQMEGEKKKHRKGQIKEGKILEKASIRQWKRKYIGKEKRRRMCMSDFILTLLLPYYTGIGT